MNQFLHYETYGPAARKGAGSWATIHGVLAEAARAPTAVGHLKQPRQPHVLFGVAPGELEEEALELNERAVDAAGRRCRRDAAILVAAVISYPVERPTVARDSEQRSRFIAWCSAVVAWLRARHGNTLRSVVLHVDEPRLHLHVFALPSLHSDGKLDWTSAHPGIEAKRWAAARGEAAKEGDAEYRLAMRKLQDDFYEAVSAPMGHARVGPARQRDNRRIAKIRQQIEVAANEKLARLEAELASVKERLASEVRALAAEREARMTAETTIAIYARTMQKQQRDQQTLSRIGARALKPINRRLVEEQAVAGDNEGSFPAP